MFPELIVVSYTITGAEGEGNAWVTACALSMPFWITSPRLLLLNKRHPLLVKQMSNCDWGCGFKLAWPDFPAVCVMFLWYTGHNCHQWSRGKTHTSTYLCCWELRICHGLPERFNRSGFSCLSKGLTKILSNSKWSNIQPSRDYKQYEVIFFSQVYQFSREKEKEKPWYIDIQDLNI